MEKPAKEYVRCRDMMLYVVIWSLKEAMAPEKKRPKQSAAKKTKAAAVGE